jgi:hypothetical protein
MGSYEYKYSRQKLTYKQLLMLPAVLALGQMAV